MVAAMAAFSIEDVLIKATSATLPAGQILILFGLGGALIFATIARRNDEPLVTAGVVSRPMRLRVFFEILGRLFYVLAITLTPLSAATVILQATPIFVVSGAAVFFREKVGWRRWLAMLIGLAGVVVIVRPGASSFNTSSVFAVLGMLGFAGRDLASRAAPSNLSTTVLGFYGFLSVFVAGILIAIWQNSRLEWPLWGDTLYLLGAVLSGVVAYSSLMKAMRTGEVSAVTPFRYSRLLYGIAFGILLFDEHIDASTMIGCGLIVLSGICIIYRPRRIT